MKLQMILTVVCILSIAVNSFGCVLFGTVKDENGKPIDAAKVKVYGKTCYGFTNSKGEFKIDDDQLIDGGRYSVTVTAKGYDSSQTLATEVFEDPEEAEPLEVVMYKEEPAPEPVPAPTNAPPVYGYGNLPGLNTNESGAEEDYSSDLIDSAEKKFIESEDKMIDYKDDPADAEMKKVVDSEDKMIDYKDDPVDKAKKQYQDAEDKMIDYK